MVDTNGLDGRDELLDLFVECVNVCEPDHPYYTNPYPITRDELNDGWCRSDGPYWAKCGPNKGGEVVIFKPDTKTLLGMDSVRLLAILTHEVSHITEVSHDKSFWREMAFNAWQIREELDRVATVLGESVTETAYVSEVITEPNEFTVDGRIETVSERRSEMARLLGRDDSKY